MNENNQNFTNENIETNSTSFNETENNNDFQFCIYCGEKIPNDVTTCPCCNKTFEKKLVDNSGLSNDTDVSKCNTETEEIQTFSNQLNNQDINPTISNGTPNNCESKFCIYCGKKIPKTDKFCKNCGESLEKKKILTSGTINKATPPQPSVNNSNSTNATQTASIPNRLCCPNCGGTNLQAVSDVQGKGASFWKLCLCGILGLFGTGKTQTTHYWVCQSCGNKFKM